MDSKNSPREPGAFVAVANEYCRSVIAGETPACRYVKQACQRQVDDLARAAAGDFPYTFEPAKAERPCRFVERLPHIKGPLARERSRLILAPWQVFVIVVAYGWVHTAGPLAGKRRFRSVYLEVPRGNGKSALLSSIALYATSADGEAGAEVYSAATTRDQARIVFDTARQMAILTPDLRNALGITTPKTAVVQESSSSSFKPLSSDEDSLEGLNIHFVAIDELHAHKRRAVYDVCETAMGKRDQPFMWIITTAGSDRSGVCFEVRSYVAKILSKAAQDESWFGVIYTIDRDENAEGEAESGDDWQAESSWIKANPNWQISVEPNHVARMAAKAMQLPSAQSNFKTKHLNVWVNADSAWLDMGAWHRCADLTLRLEDFEGEPCVIGLDLASKVDLAAKVRLFAREIDDVFHYYAFPQFYLPSRAIDDGRNAAYQGWRAQGLITETPGDVIDFAQIEDDLAEDCTRFGPVEVAYDPWQAMQLAQNMMNRDCPMVEYRQTVANFSAPMKELQALILSGRFHHNADAVFTWTFSNVVCHMDAKENIYPRKERDENKIDGAVAAIMAMGRRMTSDLTSEPRLLFV